MTNGCFFSLSILVTAFVGTAIAFACFSGAAMVARRREYLYLGGLLSSGLSILLWLQLAGSIFGHSATSFMFEVPACLYPLLIYNPMEQQCIHCLSVCEMHAHSSLGLNTCLLSPPAGLLRAAHLPGLRGVRHAGDHREGAPRRHGPRQARPHPLHRLRGRPRPRPRHHGE
jgi:hypothetical protein